ncbi:MAG: hypothetical protein KAS98_12715, partial [Deltaproteobacteria bacterium]|nr:hypothetical protein [Deltaproteobacteria bacterium]
YFKANTLIADMIYYGIREREETSSFSLPSIETTECKNLNTLWRNIKSQVSNSRIVALSLEREQVKWQIGYKIYEPEKISVFLETIWSRFDKINIQKCGNETELYAIITMSKRLTYLLRSIKKHIMQEVDTTKSAQEMFALLKKLTSSFLSLYFKDLRLNLINGGIN